MTKKAFPKSLHDLEERTRRFYSALEGEDDLGVVLRANIYVEHELREYVSKLAPRPEHIRFSDYDYNGLVALALALGLDAELKPALSAIGNLRNKFAHQIDMNLTRHEAENVYNSLSPELKSQLHQGYAATLKMPEYAGSPKSLKNLSPKEIFGMCATMVRGRITLRTVEAYCRSIGIDVPK
jgi:hypothetical protein